LEKDSARNNLRKSESTKKDPVRSCPKKRYGTPKNNARMLDLVYS
jgi:hypothetical protein